MKRSQPIQICHYRYDALDRLIGHTLTDEPQLQRFYSKNRLATEIQDAVKHSIVQHGDVLLAQQRFENDAFNTSLLATDQQRSVTQTLNADHSIQSIAYSPYGHRLPANGMCSLLGFNGERPDPVTGYYLLGNGYRAFNPVLMRFNSPDSWTPFGKGGFNSYAYCSGDPINNSDPSGHIKLPGFLKPIISLLPERVISKQDIAYLFPASPPIVLDMQMSMAYVTRPIDVGQPTGLPWRSAPQRLPFIHQSPQIVVAGVHNPLSLGELSMRTVIRMPNVLEGYASGSAIPGRTQTQIRNAFERSQAMSRAHWELHNNGITERTISNVRETVNALRDQAGTMNNIRNTGNTNI